MGELDTSQLRRIRELEAEDPKLTKNNQKPNSFLLKALRKSV